MTKEKINIKKILIKLEKKKFDYWEWDSEEEKLKVEKDLEDFKKKVTVVCEEIDSGTKKSTIIYYYEGYAEFNPVQQDGSSIKMEIKLSNEAMQSVVAMCLDSVCNLCEKQTRAFQNTFVKHVEENSDVLTSQNDKVKKSLLKRIINSN